MTRRHERFCPDLLRGLAGDRTFERGVAYHLGGHVTILGLDSERVLACVSGSEEYRTLLTGRGRAISGDCSCPAYEDRGFCKHLVAVGLAANAAIADGTTEDPLALIRAHLASLDRDTLVAIVLDLAERDPALFRRLDLAATAAGTDPEILDTRVRRAIDDATRTGGFLDYRDARDWAAGVDDALEALAGIAAGPRADIARRLAEHALARIEQAMEEIDDSAGHAGALLERARDIHLGTCRADPPDPVALARDRSLGLLAAADRRPKG
jgi:uncharacterized Zn finger protein